MVLNLFLMETTFVVLNLIEFSYVTMLCGFVVRKYSYRLILREPIRLLERLFKAYAPIHSIRVFSSREIPMESLFHEH